MRTSRSQQKIRRQSKRRQSIRRGGRPEMDYTRVQVSYDVLCDENISASDLFEMGKLTLQHMTYKNRTPYILGNENLVISRLYNRESGAYHVQFDIHFPEKMKVSDLNAWKNSYLEGIQEEKEEKSAMNGLYEPIENSFFFEYIEETEYPDYIETSGDVRDV